MTTGLEGVDRALRVLMLLGQRGDGWTLDELAAETRLPKSSLHRLLTTLKQRGFAVQAQPSGPYLLGPTALEVAFGFHARLDVPVLLAPLLQELVERHHETTHLAVLAGAEVVYIDKREGTHPFRLSSTIGGRNPAYCTGVGKALLAQTVARPCGRRRLGRASTGRCAADPDEAATAEALNAELELTRSRGYALDLEENEPGVHCAAVARDPRHRHPDRRGERHGPHRRGSRATSSTRSASTCSGRPSTCPGGSGQGPSKEALMTTIAFVGAGSVEFTRDLLADLFALPRPRRARHPLHDIDAERLETAEGIAHQVAERGSARQPEVTRSRRPRRRRSTAPTSSST